MIRNTISIFLLFFYYFLGCLKIGGGRYNFLRRKGVIQMDSLLLNIKSNWKIIQLEELIKINDPSQDLSRTAVFEREVQAAQHVDWKEIQLSLLDLKKEDGTPLSTSFQAKVSPDTAKILEQVQSDMMHQLSLKRLKVNYMVLLLQRNYLDQLISRQKNLVRKKNVCKTDRMIEEKEIDMPAMAQLLVEIVDCQII